MSHKTRGYRQWGIRYFIFSNFFTFFATLTPKTSGYMFSSMLSSNMKLFLVSDAPNNRNFVAKFENVENLSLAPISQLSYKVQITVIFSPGRQAEAKQSTRGPVSLFVSQASYLLA